MALAQAPAPDAFSGVGGLVATSGPMAKVVLVLLVLFSLLSWAIIIYKGMALHRAHAQSETFLDVFRKSNKFSEVNAVCAQLKSSPLVGVFQAGYLELNQQVRGRQRRRRQPRGGTEADRAQHGIARPLAGPRRHRRGRPGSSGA